MDERRVGEYLLLESIGSGQYGEVWKAVKGHLREEYAIKAINIKKLSADPKMKGFLEDEIKCLQLASGPNIVQFFDKLVDDRNYYLVFEYCREGTLEQLIQRERVLTEDRALLVLDQLLHAFFELYRVMIIHRDVKPSNVLIKDNVIKLADFGFSKPLATEFDTATTSVGSPIYMAPEVLQKLPYGRKVDIWSLGVVLYQMLHGDCPYNGNSLEEILSKIKKRTPVISSSISPATKSLLSQMLTVDPSRRISWEQLFELRKIPHGSLLAAKKQGSGGVSAHMPSTSASAGVDASPEPQPMPTDSKEARASHSRNCPATPGGFSKVALFTPIYQRRANTILNSEGVRQRTNPRSGIHQSITGQIIRKPAPPEATMKAEHQYQPTTDTANETGYFSKQTTQTPVNEHSSFNEMKVEYGRKLESESAKHHAPGSQPAPAELSQQQACRKNEKGAYGSSFTNNSNQTTLLKPTSYYGSFSGSNTPHNSHNKCLSYLAASRAAGKTLLPGARPADALEHELQAVLEASPFLAQLLELLSLKPISAFPLASLRRTVVRNHREAGQPFAALVSARYCAKFVQDKMRLFCSVRLPDFFLQNHLLLAMMAQTRRHLAEAVKAVSMFEDATLGDCFSDPVGVFGRVKKEADEFDQVFSRFVTDLDAYLERCDDAAGAELRQALEWPNRFDEKQFKLLVMRGTTQVLSTDECHRHRVANGLLDVLMVSEYVAKLVDFRGQDRTFEDYNCRLTNEEQAVLVNAKLRLLE